MHFTCTAKGSWCRLVATTLQTVHLIFSCQDRTYSEFWIYQYETAHKPSPSSPSYQHHDVTRPWSPCIIQQQHSDPSSSASRHGDALASSHEEARSWRRRTRQGKREAAAHGTGPAAHEPALISATRPRACRIIFRDMLLLSYYQLGWSSPPCSLILSSR